MCTNSRQHLREDKYPFRNALKSGLFACTRGGRGDLKACRDPDVVYGDIDRGDNDCSSYFELYGFTTICEEDGCSVGDELEEELH
jgi:hypothetical protein